MVGDITNLAGAIWAGLVPTVIALAIYFCFADAVLLSQCFYYNSLNARRDRKRSIATPAREENGELSENDPLLDERQGSGDNLGLPGSRRRSSAASRRSTRHSAERRDSLAKILEEEPGTNVWLKNTLSVLMILVAGSAGWAIAWKAGAWKPMPDGSDGTDDVATPLGAEILGYASAVCYLGFVCRFLVLCSTSTITNTGSEHVSRRSSRTIAKSRATVFPSSSFSSPSWVTLPMARV